LLNSNTIIAGDFNWNIIWDEKPDNPLYGNFMDVVNLLKQYDIHSVYHAYQNTSFGSEEPTLYFRKNKKATYHVDYIFASSEAISKVNKVSIGKYENWISHSDHMPLMVNFA
jgi:exodeoxyribonuclease-3